MWLSQCELLLALTVVKMDQNEIVFVQKGPPYGIATVAFVTRSHFPLKITSTLLILFKVGRCSWQHRRGHLSSAQVALAKHWVLTCFSFEHKLTIHAGNLWRTVCPLLTSGQACLKRCSYTFYHSSSSATWKATARLGKYLQGGGRGYNNIPEMLNAQVQ